MPITRSFAVLSDDADRDEDLQIRLIEKQFAHSRKAQANPLWSSSLPGYRDMNTGDQDAVRAYDGGSVGMS